MTGDLPERPGVFDMLAVELSLDPDELRVHIDEPHSRPRILIAPDDTTETTWRAVCGGCDIVVHHSVHLTAAVTAAAQHNLARHDGKGGVRLLGEP